MALALALTLWTLVVLGSAVGETSVRVPVQVANLPADYVLHSMDPGEVLVHLSGVRRRLFLLQAAEVTVSVDALLVKLGRRSFTVTPRDVSVPPGITVIAVEPAEVELDVETPPSPPPASPGNP